MMSTRRSNSLNFTMPLVLDPPRHGGLSSIALVPGRHLVGSAADCAIRLQADGVLDRHAMILVGENRTVVKAIDSRTWVNDGPVSEMALRAGDRLSIGPITFRVRAAAKDELAAFETRESFEASELPPKQSPDLVAGDAIPSTAVAMTADRQVQNIEPAPTTEAPRPLQRELQAAAVPATVVQMMNDQATAAQERAASANVREKADSGQRPHLAVIEDVPGTSRPIPDVPESETVTHAAEVRVTENTALERRLDEIQKRLADLGQSEFSFTPLSEQRASLPQRSAARDIGETYQGLNARAEQLARETADLQQRLDKVAEREALLEQRQLGLIQEAERIAHVAEMARQTLADEHAEHFSIWQEWEGTFQRITSDLTVQLSTFERQRDTFRQESQRFQAAQAELQAVRADHERDRQAHLADRIELQNELADLNSLRAQHDRLHQQQQRDLDEQSVRLELDRKRVQEERSEIATLKIELLRQRQVFDLDRSQFDVTRAGMEDSLRDLQARCQLAESDLTAWRQQRDAESVILAQTRDSENLRLHEAQKQLEETQRQLQSEHDVVTRLQHELEIVQQAAQATQASQVDSIAHADLIIATPDTSVVAPSDADDFGQDIFSEPSESPVNTASTITSPSVESNTEVVSVPASDELAWGHDSTVKSAESVPVEMTTESNHPDAFGAIIDWSALAAIEQEFGQAAISREPGHSSRFDESHPESVLSEANRRDSANVEYGSPAPVAETSIWPEQAIWPALISSHESARIENQATSAPAAVARPAAAIVPAGDDPWATFGGLETILANQFPPSPFDEILSAGMSVTAESDTGYAQSDFGETPFEAPLTPAPTSEQLDAERTLAEINREFGTEIPEQPSNESKSSLPAWWVENTKAETVNSEPAGEIGKPSWVLDALRANPADQPEEAPLVQSEKAEEPVSDLRSKLAMLFELPAQATSAIADPLPLNESSSEAPAHIAEAVPEVIPEVPSHEAGAHGEDSVDAFMARLLARSRTGGGEPSAVAAPQHSTPAAAAPAIKPGSKLDEEAAATPALPEHDRSHLMQGPKHKQDRQAVREHLQSFRQVAHLSARSALAKHSIQQLRNATIAKGVLLAATGIATIWFFGEPLVGRSLQLWKGSACALGLILAAIEFNRSWHQLMKPIRAASASNADLEMSEAETAADSMTDSADVATADVASEPNVGEANSITASDAATDATND